MYPECQSCSLVSMFSHSSLVIKMGIKTRWAKERFQLGFKKRKEKKLQFIWQVCLIFQDKSLFQMQATANYYFTFIIIKCLLWLFFSKERENLYMYTHTYTHTKGRAKLSLKGRLLLAPAWKKSLSQWDYVLSHNLSVVWSEIHNAAHLSLSSARAARLNLNRQMPDLGVDILSVFPSLSLSPVLPIKLSLFSFSNSSTHHHFMIGMWCDEKLAANGGWRGRHSQRQREGEWENEMEGNCKLLLSHPHWDSKTWLSFFFFFAFKRKHFRIN